MPQTSHDRRTFDCAERKLLLISVMGSEGIWDEIFCTGNGQRLGPQKYKSKADRSTNVEQHSIPLEKNLEVGFVLWNWRTDHTSTGFPFLAIYRLFWEIGCNTEVWKATVQILKHWLIFCGLKNTSNSA